MKCQNCGVENPEKNKFCNNCGTTLIETEVTYKVKGNAPTKKKGVNMVSLVVIIMTLTIMVTVIVITFIAIKGRQ